MTRLLRPVIVIALVCGACTGAPPSPTAGDAPRRGGRVIEGAASDVISLFPSLGSDAVSARATGKIYATLWRADPATGEILPHLGRWTTSADGRTYSWEIGASATWSDGTQITGEDYLTAVKAVAESKGTVRRSSFQDIRGFAEYREGRASGIAGIVVDGKRFTVSFTQAVCSALVNAFGPAGSPIPSHVFGAYTSDPARNVDDAPEILAPPVASGPFVLKEWRRSDQLILAANARYFAGRPLVDEYVLKVVADTSAVALGLRTGELTFSAIQAPHLRAIESEPRLRVLRYPAPRSRYIGWNVRSATAPALADKRIRQALAYGLDMDAVIRAVLDGHGERMFSHHSRHVWAFPSSGINTYPYDPAAARRLIEQAGYARGTDGIYAKGGAPLELSIVAPSGGKDFEAILAIAAEQYGTVGIRVRQRIEDSTALISRLTTGDPTIEAWVFGWNTGPDPDPYSIWHSSQIPDRRTGKAGFNIGGFTAPGLDKAIEDGRSGSCDRAARKASYETFNRILNDEQPYNFGYMPLTLVGADRGLRGFEPGPFDEAPSIEKWWLASP